MNINVYIVHQLMCCTRYFQIGKNMIVGTLGVKSQACYCVNALPRKVYLLLCRKTR